MKKRTLGVLVLVLLVLSTVVIAEENSQDCGFFCKVINWWNEFRGGESVVGKATGEVYG